MSDKLLAGLHHHQAGDLDQAARVYREILAEEPQNADALHLLGMVFHKQGRHTEAMDLIRNAITLAPDFAEYHNNLASIQLETGDPSSGELSCREAIRLKPGFAPAHCNLGNALQGLGRFPDAVACYEQAIRLDPSYALAYANLGGLLQRLGRLPEAVNCCRRALELRPGMPEPLHNLGEILRIQGKPHDAIGCFQLALSTRPDSADIHNNLGNALKDAGRLDDAIQSYRRAIELRPQFPLALNNLGVALREHGQLPQAEQSLEKAIEIDPNYAQAHANLANIWRLQSRLEDAAKGFERAIQLNPDDAEAQNNFGELHWKRHRLDEAVACFRQAIALSPSLPTAYYNLGNVLRERGDLEGAAACYRDALAQDDRFTPALNNLGLTLSEQGKTSAALECFQRALAIEPSDSRLHSHVLVCQQYLDGVSLKSLSDAHAEWNDRHAAALKSDWIPLAPSPAATRPLRLGFVSRDFRQHPVGYFLMPVFETLDRSRFETTVYCDQREDDDFTHRFRAAAKRWRSVSDLTDKQLADQMREDQIDILIDLAGHTAAHRLLAFARKPARAQATWMGYVGTTGLDAIDYLISDNYHTPVGVDDFYRERIIRLPDGYVCFAPPEDACEVGPLPAKANGFVTFGSFNNPAKLSAATVKLWSRILHRMPDSRLRLKYTGLDDRGARQNFAKLFEAEAISVERVDFLGPSSHQELLRAYCDVDIALDPTPYSGGLTTCEALWMGVPVITCPGETFASRHSLSHLSNSGISQTIAADMDDYVEQAVSLASQIDTLAAMRVSLRERLITSPLCDTVRFTRQLEAALQQMASR